MALCCARYLKIGTLASNRRQIGKSVRFKKKCTKRTIQAMRNMFWPNRGFQCLRSQNGPTGLKSSPYREYSALSMKSEQKSLSRSCGARFGKMALSSAKNRTLVLLAFTGYKSSSSQKRTIQNALFRPCETCFGQIAVSSALDLKMVQLA